MRALACMARHMGQRATGMRCHSPGRQSAAASWSVGWRPSVRVPAGQGVQAPGPVLDLNVSGGHMAQPPVPLPGVCPGGQPAMQSLAASRSAGRVPIVRVPGGQGVHAAGPVLGLKVLAGHTPHAVPLRTAR